MTSQSTVSVAVDTPTEPPSMDEQLANAGLDAEGNRLEGEAPTQEPILGKFKSVDDLAKAYSELEKKLGSGGEAPPQGSTEPETLSIPKDAATKPSSDDETTSMEQLLKDGMISQEVYDTWQTGQEAAANQFNNAVYEVAGGTEAYNELIGWAGNNLPDDEIDSFNELLTSGNLSAIKLAVSGLKAQMAGSGASEPSRTVAGGTPGGADRFNSWAEVHEAMADPRYSKDRYFNQQVVEKIGRSAL